MAEKKRKEKHDSLKMNYFFFSIEPQYEAFKNKYIHKWSYEQKRRASLQECEKKLILTSTHSIDGYSILTYLGVLSGEIVVPNGLLGAVTSGTFFTIDALDKARKGAIEQLTKKAAEAGADAIVALDIDISDLNGRGVLVSANGTAVKIAKTE